MPPALSDALVGWASGPVGAERRREGDREAGDERGQERGQAQSRQPVRGRGRGRIQSPQVPLKRSRGALEALLVDLGSQIQLAPNSSPASHGDPSDPSRVCATGLPALDRRLGGGFPRGRLSEICGPPSSGRTALALMSTRTTLRRGGLTGWVDLADAFDPISAAASGVALERLLWVRPRCENEALQSCDRLLQTEGFELIVFDCVPTALGAQRFRARSTPRRHAPSSSSTPTAPVSRTAPRTSASDGISDVAWLRLSRLAAKTQTAFVVLSQGRAQAQDRARDIVQGRARDRFSSEADRVSPEGFAPSLSVTGSRAAIVLEMLPLGARFMGSPSLLDSLEATAILRRHRTRPSGAEILFSATFDGCSPTQEGTGAATEAQSESETAPEEPGDPLVDSATASAR